MSNIFNQATQERTFQKLVGDPFAPEAQWLPACAENSENSQNSDVSPRSLTRRNFFLPLAVLAAAAVACQCAWLVQMGYDMGYRLIELLFTQNAGGAQGSMAIFSLAFIVIPLTFGLAFGALRSFLRGSSKAWTVVGYLIPTLWAAFVSNLAYDHGAGETTFFQTCLWFTVALSCSVIAVSAGHRLAKLLSSRMKVARLLLTATVSLVPFAAASQYLQSLHVRSEGILLAEILLYLATVATPVCVALRGAKVSDRIGAFTVGCLAVLPLIVCNVLNVLCNLLSLSLDTFKLGAGLSWHALASALFLNGILFAAVMAGSFIGWKPNPVLQLPSPLSGKEK